MKKYFKFSSLCIFIFLILLLCFPTISMKGAKSGLLLWFETILPVLFPFMITIRLLEDLKLTEGINRLLSPVICRIFSVSPAASFTIVSGFLCGFPLGAKSCANCVVNGSLSKEEGQYVLSFCNNVSPSFLLGYITVVLLNQEGASFFIISILSAIITGRMLYLVYYRKTLKRHIPTAQMHDSGTALSDTATHEPKKKQTLLQLLDRNILSCAEVLVKVGGFMILFSILSQLAFHTVLKFQDEIPNLIQSVLLFLCGTLEVTQGTSFVSEAISRGMICSHFLPTEQIKIVLILILTSFGGFSAIAQTQSVISKSGLSIRQYSIARLVNAGITGILCILFLKIRHLDLW